MSKVIISKHKLDKIESLLWALTSACFMTATMEGRVTEGMAKMRDRAVKQILDLLTNDTNVQIPKNK